METCRVNKFVMLVNAAQNGIKFYLSNAHILQICTEFNPFYIQAWCINARIINAHSEHSFHFETNLKTLVNNNSDL